MDQYKLLGQLYQKTRKKYSGSGPYPNQSRPDQWYTLPRDNVRVRQETIRPLIERIEQAFMKRSGIKPSRSKIVEAALNHYLQLILSTQGVDTP